MNLKDNLSKFQSKADEGIFFGYSINSVAYRVLNKRKMKIEETFNLMFDDHYVKRVEKSFVQKPIIETQITNTLDFNYDLIFGVPDRTIDAKVNVDDNQIPEVSHP